jgi:pimeloyl-ACP methyl ester carboxylesterase
MSSVVKSANVRDEYASAIYRSAVGAAEIEALYQAALSRLGGTVERRRVATGVGETHLLVAGEDDAPPVLVLPGGNFLNPTCLEWFLPLARRYRLYAPDIPGQPGFSAPRRLSPRGDAQATWLTEVLDALGIETAVCVGLSYGAGLALRLAGFAPQRVSRLALVSPAGLVLGPMGRMMTEIVMPMYAYRFAPSDERLMRAVRPILSEPDGELARQIGAIYRQVRLDTRLPRRATAAELRACRAQALVIAAADDPFFPGERVATKAREVLPVLNGVEVLAEGHHIPTRAAFDGITRRIGEFLDATR